MVIQCVSRYIDYKTKSGRVSLIPNDAEDMWHIYNLIQASDLIRASTIRKVQSESATGSTSSNRVRTMLTVAVEKTEFDTEACVLRINGRNVQENKYVKLQAYHTIDLELNRKFVLTKPEWDSMSLERLDLACDASQSAEIAAVIMQEGLCNICLVTAAMTIVRQKIEHTIPRKRKGYNSQHEKAIDKFFDQIVQGMLRHINFDIVKCIIVASPGFTKDRFKDYLFNWAEKNDERKLLDQKSKIVLAHSSSGFKYSLKDILADPVLQSRLADTKAAEEVKALHQFLELMHTDPDRACYGIVPVEQALEENAIDVLLLSDNLFRSLDLRKRKRYVALVDTAREKNAVVRVFSSLHVSGEQLMQVGGVAAILRYPMPHLDYDFSEPEDEE